jgi:peroxiredoxin
MRSGPIRPGEESPDFLLPAADNTLWKRSDFLLRPRTLLIFYQRGCAASRLVLMMAERLHRRLGRHGLQIAGVAQESHPDTMELADAYQITFPLLLDYPRLALTSAFGADRTPFQVLLDEKGKVLETLRDFSREEEEELGRRLSRALGCAEVPLVQPGDKIPERLAGNPSARPAGEGDAPA